jgi:hypothetical protein
MYITEDLHMSSFVWESADCPHCAPYTRIGCVCVCVGGGGGVFSPQFLGQTLPWFDGTTHARKSVNCEISVE